VQLIIVEGECVIGFMMIVKANKDTEPHVLRCENSLL